MEIRTKNGGRMNKPLAITVMIGVLAFGVAACGKR